jgi:hypothetical protein
MLPNSKLAKTAQNSTQKMGQNSVRVYNSDCNSNKMIKEVLYSIIAAIYNTV